MYAKRELVKGTGLISVSHRWCTTCLYEWA